MWQWTQPAPGLPLSQLNRTSPAQSPMVVARGVAGVVQGGNPRGDHPNHRAALLGPRVNPVAVGRMPGGFYGKSRELGLVDIVC